MNDWLIVLSVLFVFGGDKKNPTFFTKAKFHCTCESDRSKKKLLITEYRIRQNSDVLVLQIRTTDGVINDSIQLTKVVNKLYIGDSSTKSVFIDFDKEEFKYNFFNGTKIFGGASYIYHDTLIKESCYKISAHFEGALVDSKVLYQLDFNKSNQVFRFFFFDGTRAYKCQ